MERSDVSKGAKRVAIVTGGGRGLGRAYAHLLADRGMSVLVNSFMSDDREPPSADEVVDEIREQGGEAEAHVGDVSSWAEAHHLIEHAIGAFGRLDVLVSNAGVLRDRTIANMSEEEWDLVVDVHLKGQAAPLHWAAAFWRDRSKAGDSSPAAVVNTTAGAGLFGNLGQSNYAAAKAGVVGLTLVAARELQRYNVRVNAVAPVARTRQTAALFVGSGRAAPADASAFDRYDPANAAPLVAYLVDENCPFTGQVFNVQGGQVAVYDGWTVREVFSQQRRWTVDELRSALSHLPAGPPAFAPPRLEEDSQPQT
jgi:NAD(P)-dependent dehydrogenase (short-subunit alcohol dehydrogenase family)